MRMLITCLATTVAILSIQSILKPPSCNDTINNQLKSSRRHDVATTSDNNNIDYRQCYHRVKGAFAANATANAPMEFCKDPCVDDLQDRLAFTRLLGDANFMLLADNKGKGRGKVMVNSPGGVGSTYFVEQLQRLNLTTNDAKNYDKLKHITVERLMETHAYHPPTATASKANRKRPAPIPRALGERRTITTAHVKSYDRILYVTGDPIHCIFSLFRRGWERAHYRSLCGAHCPLPWQSNNNITSLFETSARLGYDAWSLHKQAKQWIQLQHTLHFSNHNDHSVMVATGSIRPAVADRDDFLGNKPLDYAVVDFPPILVTDVHTAKESPAVLAYFLGVEPEAVQLEEKRVDDEPQKLQQRQEERRLLQQVGALDIYLAIEEELQQVVAQNYLSYGIRMFCRERG